MGVNGWREKIGYCVNEGRGKKKFKSPAVLMHTLSRLTGPPTHTKKIESEIFFFFFTREQRVRSAVSVNAYIYTIGGKRSYYWTSERGL